MMAAKIAGFMEGSHKQLGTYEQFAKNSVFQIKKRDRRTGSTYEGTTRSSKKSSKLLYLQRHNVKSSA